MTTDDGVQKRKRRGPKPRYRVNRQDFHITLSTELLQRIDEVAEEGRAEYIEQTMRQHFDMPPLKEQQDG